MKYGIRLTGRKPNGQFYYNAVYILFDTEEEAKKHMEWINQTPDKNEYGTNEYTIVSGDNLELYRMVNASYVKSLKEVFDYTNEEIIEHLFN